MSTRTSGRRADHAELPRQAIIDAARTLFAQHGFFGAKIDEIAELADVALGTVYAVGGGKQGLLRILIDEWAAAPVLKESVDRLPSLRDPHEVLALAAACSRKVRENHGTVVRVLLSAAPHDETAAEGLRESTERYRNTLAAVAQHLHELGAPADRTDARHARSGTESPHRVRRPPVPRRRRRTAPCLQRARHGATSSTQLPCG
ncbi:TetR/AcrR family transcriptional regulator [Streptomyces sp. NPDC127072]|uniref:TetR/AcrR family transcriptional regulator n=1 Tax=Streptomyces sp. NPDC127072 TaxID=3347129 RepID=UPI00365D5D5E